MRGSNVARWLGGSILLAVWPLLGCATAVRGTMQEVRLLSEPPGATVTLGGQNGTTPCRFILPRNWEEETVSFSLAGHETYRAEVQPRQVPISSEPWLLPVVIVSGLMIIPGIVDLCSGCLYDWPYEIKATLPPQGNGTALLDISRKKPEDYQRPKLPPAPQ